MPISEPGRTSCYSDDLRWLCIWSMLVYGRSCNEKAQKIGISSTTVANWWPIFQETDDVHKRRRNVPPTPPDLDAFSIAFWFTLFERVPHILLSECAGSLRADLTKSGLCKVCTA